MKTEVRAWFRVTGLFDPSEVTAALGVAPTRTWRKGEREELTPCLLNEADAWEVASPLGKELVVAEHFRALLLVFHPHAAVIRQFCAAHPDTRSEFMAEVMSNEGNPNVYYLDRELVRQIADVGAGLDMDDYNLPEDDDEW